MNPFELIRSHGRSHAPRRLSGRDNWRSKPNTRPPFVGSGRIAVLEHIIGLAANFGEVMRRVQPKCRFTQLLECPTVAWTAGSKRPTLRPVGKLPAKDPAIEGEG